MRCDPSISRQQKAFPSVVPARVALWHFAYVIAVAALWSQAVPAWADILKTRHNFLPVALGPRDSAKEVCVFCHAPSLVEGEGEMRTSAQTDIGPSVVPVWQTGLSPGQFGFFDDFGRGGVLAGQGNGSVSVACLSCHDGSQAWAVLPEYMGDHPFGVPYRGFRMDNALAQVERQKRRELAAAFRESLRDLSSNEFRPVQSAASNKRRFWWTSLSSTGNVKTKNDITFTPRTLVLGDQVFEVPYVECSSCHDPHAEKPLFLRLENAGSRVCLTCHLQ